eukprot:GHRR01025190.1.p1 GENE.GHRR01025190.1~~GHRR01025190.1.p1  ORF type:complete len:554 (+),score=179.00 GHRR01025190.1:215-1876(+)
MVVLDAGSTGTRVHVFQYAAQGKSSYAIIKLPELKLKVEPGLSSYANNAAGAGMSLQPLLQFAQHHVPAGQRISTPIYLMATAGMRLLPAVAAESIMAHCRDSLSVSGFLFEPEWASIISGRSEGLYAWVAANYAAGNLQAAARNLRSRKEPPSTPSSTFKALLELGGASAQVTFMPDQHWVSKSSTSSSSTGQENLRLPLPGVTRPLWSHSYLGYGFDVVEQQVDALVFGKRISAVTANLAAAAPDPPGPPKQQLQAPQQPASSVSQLTEFAAGAVPILDPCLPAGYIPRDGRTGTGEWHLCQQLVAQAMDPTNCKAAADRTCPEIPKSLPKLTGDLLAIENFAYTAHALALPELCTIGDFASAARQFCSRPWPQTLLALDKEPEQQRYLWRYCFGSAFAWTLLHDVLQLEEGQVVHFTNMLKNREGAVVGLDWALGAAVLQLSSSGGSEGALLRQQEQVRKLVLLAALLGTVALLLAAAVAVTGSCSARPRSQLGSRPGSGQRKVVQGSTSASGKASSESLNDVWTAVRLSRPGAGRQLYTAVPLTTRLSR